MGKLMAREALLVLISGLLGMFYIPVLFGKPPETGLFWVGVIMGLTFMPMYGIAVMSGNRMPARVRNWLGVAAFVGAFAVDWLAGTAGLLQANVPWQVWLMTYAPTVFGLVLALLGRRRPGGALTALFAYSLPMVLIRWVLVQMVSVNGVLMALVYQVGAIYLFLRVLIRLFWPSSIEGGEATGPLVRRAVPDRIVGLVEGTARRAARPYATTADGMQDEEAISILCRPEDVAGVTARLQQALAGMPLTVAPGVEAEPGKVEIVIRPRT